MGKPHGIELIIFDLGRVLLDFDFMLVIRNLQRHTTLSEDQIHTFFKDTPLWDRFERGHVEPEHFFREMSNELKLNQLTFEAFKPIWNNIFEEKKDTIELLKRLRGRYRTAMLSNVNIMHWEFARQNHEFMHWFDFPVASYATGFRKPDLEIFHHVLSIAKIPAEKAVFIDDIESHITAARKVGIRAHQFTDAKQLKIDLDDILL